MYPQVVNYLINYLSYRRDTLLKNPSLDASHDKGYLNKMADIMKLNQRDFGYYEMKSEGFWTIWYFFKQDLHRTDFVWLVILTILFLIIYLMYFDLKSLKYTFFSYFSLFFVLLLQGIVVTGVLY